MKGFIWDKERRKWRERKRKRRTERWRDVEELRENKGKNGSELAVKLRNKIQEKREES